MTDGVRGVAVIYRAIFVVVATLEGKIDIVGYSTVTSDLSNFVRGL